MNFLDKITEIVAGRGISERAEERAFRRRHELRRTEESLRRTNTAAPEPPPNKNTYSPVGIPARRGSSQVSFHRPTTPRPYQIPILRPKIVRSRSEDAPIYPRESPIGPPDLTAVDLSSDELQRTYSTDNLWNLERQSIPPIFPCRGFGKYRMSTMADPEFHAALLERSHSTLTPDMVAQLSGTMVAEANPSVWQKHIQQHASRRSSIASSVSSYSNPSPNVYTEYIDPTTGTRVSKGFAPSYSTSAASSYKDASAVLRRDSGMSIPSPTSDRFARSEIRSNRPTSARSSDHLVVSPLSTIKEMHQPTTHNLKKVEKPCEFGKGGASESAIASDDEDEDGWTDTFEGQPSQLTRQIKNHGSRLALPARSQQRQEVHHTRTSSNAKGKPKQYRIASERARALNQIRPQFRRTHSRNVSVGKDQLGIPHENHATMRGERVPEQSEAEDTNKPDKELVNEFPVPSEQQKNSDDSESDSILWMKLANASQQKPDESEEDVNSTTSKSSTPTLTPEDKVEPLVPQGRTRSGTVIRVTQAGVDRNGCA